MEGDVVAKPYSRDTLVDAIHARALPPGPFAAFHANAVAGQAGLCVSSSNRVVAPPAHSVGVSEQ